MCCLVHGSELIRLGFDADIDLEDTRPEEPPHTKIYLWLPTVDKAAPRFDQLAIGVGVLDTIVKRNLKVYVHCHNGHGRAPTLVAAYFISLGQSVEQAIAAIKQKRPAIHLQVSQIEMLKKFSLERGW